MEMEKKMNEDNDIEKLQKIVSDKYPDGCLITVNVKYSKFDEDDEGEKEVAIVFMSKFLYKIWNKASFRYNGQLVPCGVSMHLPDNCICLFKQERIRQ